MSHQITRTDRARRVTAKVTRGRSEERPQLRVFRSNAAIYAQVISGGKTLAAADDRSSKGKPVERAAACGKAVAEAARKAGVEAVTFHRGAYRYHGRVKALAEAAREAGMKF